MPGRPRKPTTLHALEGTRPGATTRDRAAEPIPDPIGSYPAHYDKPEFSVHALVWDEILAAVPPGVITEADRFALEIAVALLVRLRAGILKTAEIAALQRALSSLGMTPADRSKVGVPGAKGKEAEESPWDRLGRIGAA